MAKVVVVTSGKGGVGKTTSTAALGAALAQFGQNVVVVDFDVGLRNLDLVMGAERRVVYDLINVTQGIAKLPQALIRDKRLERLALLPASQTRDKDALTEDGVARVINSLKQMFDWVICDSPAGIERGATLAMRFADTAIVVTNPEVSSVRDSDRIIGMLDSKTARAERGERVEKHILITRYDPARAARGEMRFPEPRDGRRARIDQLDRDDETFQNLRDRRLARRHSHVCHWRDESFEIGMVDGRIGPVLRRVARHIFRKLVGNGREFEAEPLRVAAGHQGGA